MTFDDDLIHYELCFPGGVSGRAEVHCPHCRVLLTVPVEDPMGQQEYECSQCEGGLEVDWARQAVSPLSDVELLSLTKGAWGGRVGEARRGQS